MNAQRFSQAMSELDSKYIDEAIHYKKKKVQPPVFGRWAAIAACLAVVVVAAFSILPNYLSPQAVTPPDHSNSVITDTSTTDTPPTTSEIHISMGDMFLNEISESSDTARKWYDPALFDKLAWDKNAIKDYYKKDLTPAYVPNGLRAASGNGTATVYADKSGEVIEDTVWLGFYHAYYADGSPKLTENIAACKGFSVTVSKLGLLNACIYRLQENEAKTSDISGISVTFGYRSVPYGPYTPDTHKPSGYYDMYIAEFKQDGIEYQIVADQMELEEIVKIVSSIIYGEEVVVEK